MQLLSFDSDVLVKSCKTFVTSVLLLDILGGLEGDIELKLHVARPTFVVPA